MNLEGKLSARKIAVEAGMSPRPEFYSGRGAILGDLNSDYLGKIHELIKREYGEEAGKSFVEMVANTKVLSATDFLTCLYHLEGMDWKYDGFQSDLTAGVDVAKDKEGNYDAISGMVGVMNAMSSSGRDETESIRNPFLRFVGYEIKPKKRKVGNDGFFDAFTFHER